MKILFLHGWHSVPGGVKPTFLAQRGHEVLNPALPDEDFAAAVSIAQAEFDHHQPGVIVGSSRGGAVAMNLKSDRTPLVLLCPAWKNWGTAKRVKQRTVILHSEEDDVIPIADSRELVRNSGLPESALVVVGKDHRLADAEPLQAMLKAVANFGSRGDSGGQDAIVPCLFPEMPFPPYTFVPGQTPHPTSDPAGHSFGMSNTPADKLDTQRWEASKAYLYGIDLFNGRYYWESHEQWESLWHACGRTGLLADFLKGLIKLAAAGVKHREGNAVGVKSHACRAAELWQGVAQSLEMESGFFLGFRIRAMVDLAEEICKKGWPEAPVILVPNFTQF